MAGFVELCCPRPECRSLRFRKDGFSRPVACLQGSKRQRYVCCECGKKFSENYFDIGFRQKKADRGLNFKIFRQCLEGTSNRRIARLYFISANCVRLRLIRMAQQALSFHAKFIEQLLIAEAIAYDGLENFATSQYDPNNINQAIGRESLFIYDFNFAGLNRKGRTSNRQKRRKLEIETSKGRYDPAALRTSTEAIIKRLEKKVDPKAGLDLLTDEHFQYKRALHNLKSPLIHHVTISSKAHRDFQNILFSVNHSDLKIRYEIASFKRETISFAKTEGAMCQKFSLFMIYKNFMAPQFTKKIKRRPEAHKESPAQALKLCDHILDFWEVFHERSTKNRIEHLNDDWKCFWMGQVPKAYQRSDSFCSPKQRFLKD